MVSAVNSTGSSSVITAISGVEKIAALNKQADALRQQLAQAKTAKPADFARSKTESITQEIVSVQNQIEQVILAAQLSKLTAGNNANNDQSGDGNNNADNGSDDSKSGAHKVNAKSHPAQSKAAKDASASYDDTAQQAQGQYVDIKA